MLAFISVIAGMIPGLSGLISAITTAWFNSKVMITTAKIGGDTAVATALVTAETKDFATSVQRLQVMASSKALMALIFLFAGPWIWYEWKVIVWDTILGWGTTNAIHGDMGSWGHIIILSLFGSGTSLAVGHMYFNRKDQ